MSEKWIKWEPVNDLASKYYIDAISSTSKGFKIELSQYKNEKNKLIILFSDSVYSYRSVDEILMTNMMYQLTEKYGDNFLHDWTFFKVTDSYYLQWLSEQSSGLSNYRALIHFSLISVDSVLDVFCNYEPKVEFINDSKSNVE